MKIALLSFDSGWDVLYFDGVRVWEGSRLTATELMNVLLERKIFLEDVDFVSESAQMVLSEETLRTAEEGGVTPETYTGPEFGSWVTNPHKQPR